MGIFNSSAPFIEKTAFPPPELQRHLCPKSSVGLFLDSSICSIGLFLSYDRTLFIPGTLYWEVDYQMDSAQLTHENRTWVNPEAKSQPLQKLAHNCHYLVSICPFP